MTLASTTAVAPQTGQEGRTKNSVMATTLIGAHAFEHLYAHSIPLLAPIILADLGANATLGLLIPAIRSIFGESAVLSEDSLWTCITTGWHGSCP